MDGSAAEQERKLINLFPLSKQSVLSAFRELDSQENPSGAQTGEEENRGLLRESNPSVLADLERLLEPYTEENAKQMFWGALVFHRALRKEAKFKGVTLPTLTEQFIEYYEEKKENSAEQSRIGAFRDRNLSIDEAGREFRRRNIATFRNLEPEFSKVVESKLGTLPNWLPEEDFRYTGIIYQYLLFRKGFSDPKNFQSAG